MFLDLRNAIKNILIIIILLFSGCGAYHTFFADEDDNTVVTKIVTEVDTTYVNVTDTVPQYIPKIQKEFFEIEVERDLTRQDSIDIVNSFYKKRIYVDSLETEYGNVVLTDTIWQNKIISRDFTYDFEIPVVTKKITIYKETLPSRFQLYTGVSGRFSIESEHFGVLENKYLEPQAYVEGKFRFGKHHYVTGRFDAYRMDGVFGYTFKKGRWEFDSNYSLKYRIFEGDLKFYIIK